uniref:Mediator of RNA polymerase II transcription subunit 23 n=1 Tax=Meloidogyne hapla TaxID=6305 RepID=A0A1I8BJS7_MELHA
MEICAPSTSLATIDKQSEQQPKHSNFNYFAVGNEAEKLKWLVLQHVKPSTFKRIFAPLRSNKKPNRSDELTCIEACMLLKSIQDSPEKLEHACNGLISLLNNEKVHLYALDRIITKIITTAVEEKIISLLLACQLLVSSIDFRMERRPNPEKIKFVRKSMDQMDYKNMRDLVKLLLVEKLDKMYCELNEYQHQQLEPIEELVIDLIDRQKNFCPALFFITEVSRIDTDFSSIHFLPRVSLKIREMVASFRPLAEIGCMLGRSWMWPVPASPIFSWSSPTWSAWKLDEKHCKLHFKTHLPYSSENSSPQTYLQYVLFKQPHGQDNLNHILRPSSSTPQVQPSKLQCDEVIQLLILEAMSAMEDCEQPVLAPINQYNWLHLSHLVTYALTMGHCTLSQLLMMLLPQLRSCQYLHAKEELMWILLQYIAHAKSKEKYTQGSSSTTSILGLPASGGLGVQNRELVLEIFNVLYTDKSMNWGNSCSTEQPLEMVRFFAPAAIWSHLVTSLSAAPGSEQIPQPQPPEKLRKLIDFIENQLRDNKDQKQLERNSALLAVVANAYSNNLDVFDEHVNNTVFPELSKLGQQRNQTIPPTIQQEKWTLPVGRKTEPFLRALELTFLDSLTFHAKRQLYNYALNRVCKLILNQQQSAGHNQQQQPSFILRLPSPALVESIARLLLSTELCDENGKHFFNCTIATLNPAPGQPESQHMFLARNDFSALLLELLNFRLQNIGFAFILSIIDQLLNNPMVGSMPSNVQMAQLLEQTLLRFAQCTFPNDLINTLHQLWFVIPKMFKTLPEICRSFLLNAVRAFKLLGHVYKPCIDVQSVQSIPTTDDKTLMDSIPGLGVQWPRYELQWFPTTLQQVLYKQLAKDEEVWIANQTQRLLELEQASAQEMQHLVHLNHDYFMQNFQQSRTSPQPPTLFISIFRCLYQSQLPNFQFPQPLKPPHPSAPNFFALCYKILGALGNRELHKLTNALIDWLACKCGWLGQDSAPSPGHDEYDLNHILKVLNDMLFSHQVLSVDRLLFSIALHPTDDQSSRTLICLLAALLESKFSQLPERLHACYTFAPPHSQTTSSNSEEFFMQMVEYYKKYPEYSFNELYRRAFNPQAQQEASSQIHNLPVYYGHLAERICPIVDILLQKALSMDLKPAVMDTLLCHFSPIYRIHPQPMNFLYTTLYCLDGILLAHQQEAANCQSFLSRPVRKFVLEIVLKLEQEEMPQTPLGRNPVGKLLTTEFIQLDHQMPAVKFCRILVERIVQASTYTHQPPSFVHSDWRFAEFPPAAQALTSAWVELLASRHSAADIIEALVQLAIRRPISRPQDTLNALGLLLTGLPSSFQSAFLDKIEQSFDWEQISKNDSDPAQLFESLSHEVYLHSESQILSMLALFHSFCQHGGNNSLNIIPDLIVQRLSSKVQNEAQLIYFLRIVVPYLQRITEKERNRHMTEIVAIYQVLGNLTQKVGRLQYEDTICDLLYQFKYMFVGYLLKDQIEETIRSFPESMREKLKFLLTHSSAAANETQQQQMQQIIQQQQILVQHQSSFGNLLPGMPNAAAVMVHQQQHQQTLQQQSSFDHQPSSTPSLAGMIRRLSRTESDSASVMQQYGGIPPNTLEQQQNFAIHGMSNIQQQMSSSQQQHFPSSSSINPMMGNIPLPSMSSFPSSSNTNQGMQQQQQILPPPPPYSQQQSTSMGMMPTSTPFSGHQQIPSSSSSNMHYMMGPGPSNFGPPQAFINATQMAQNPMSFAAFQQQQHMAAQMSGSHHGGPVNLMGGGQQSTSGGGSQLPPNFPSGSQGGF